MTVAQQILFVRCCPQSFSQAAVEAICNHVKTLSKAEAIDLVKATCGGQHKTKPKAIEHLRAELEAAIGT